MELYSNSFLSSLNWSKLVQDILANEYSYYTVEVVNHLVQSLLESTERPNLQKLRTWLPVCEVIKTNSKKTKVYGCCHAENPFIVLKHSSCEYTVELNPLRNHCVFFPFIYAKITACEVIDDKEVVLALFPSLGEKLEYTFSEMITYEYKLNVFLRLVDSTLEEYLSLYAQVIKSMELAYKHSKYVNSIDASNLVVSYRNDQLYNITIGKSYIKANRIVRSLNCDVSKGRVSEAIYNFTASFIYNLRFKHSKTAASEEMISLLINALLELKIPFYYINNLLRQSVLEMEDMPIDLELSYSQLFKCLDKPLTNVLFLGEGQIIGQEFKIESFIRDDLGILYLYYSSHPYNDQSEWLSAYISKNHNIKLDIDDSFRQIDDIKPVLCLNSTLLDRLDMCYSNIINYFETLLYIKLLLDDLKRRLEFFRELREDIINDILHSYIVENSAKLARKAAENINVYEACFSIMSKRDINKIKVIWGLLDSKESLK